MTGFAPAGGRDCPGHDQIWGTVRVWPRPLTITQGAPQKAGNMEFWSERRDLNSGPPVPQMIRGVLPAVLDEHVAALAADLNSIGES
jgi:hypothetical protein